MKQMWNEIKKDNKLIIKCEKDKKKNVHNRGWKIQMFDKAKKAPFKEAYLSKKKQKYTLYAHL